MLYRLCRVRFTVMMVVMLFSNTPLNASLLFDLSVPSGLHTNCYAFIRMVTGVTRSVISSVNSYMRETGGRRDPPPHGLKTFWENHPKRRKLDNKTDNIVSLQDGGIMSGNLTHFQTYFGKIFLILFSILAIYCNLCSVCSCSANVVHIF